MIPGNAKEQTEVSMYIKRTKVALISKYSAMPPQTPPITSLHGLLRKGLYIG
jgi:hypothetical protein